MDRCAAASGATGLNSQFGPSEWIVEVQLRELVGLATANCFLLSPELFKRNVHPLIS